MSMGVRGIVVSILAALPVLAMAAGDGTGGPPSPVEAPPSPPAPSYSLFPPAAAAAGEPIPLPKDLPEGWYAWIDTSMGAIVARLLPEQAPQSVAHFAALAEGRLGWPDPLTGETRREPYYDGLLVTRARAQERIELGQRTEVGRNVPSFFVPQEGEGPVNFSAPGRLGMVAGSMNRISGVKFTITAGTYPPLNRFFPCFGIVVSGLDVVERISEVKTYRNEMPIEPVTVKKIRVRKVGNPPPLPDPVPHTPKPAVPTVLPSPR